MEELERSGFSAAYWARDHDLDQAAVTRETRITPERLCRSREHAELDGRRILTTAPLQATSEVLGRRGRPRGAVFTRDDRCAAPDSMLRLGRRRRSSYCGLLAADFVPISGDRSCESGCLIVGKTCALVGTQVSMY